MASYDGEIRINTKISISEAKMQLRQLESALAATGKQIERQQKKLADLSPKLAEYNNEKMWIEAARTHDLTGLTDQYQIDNVNGMYDLALENLETKYSGVIQQQAQYNATLEAAKQKQGELTIKVSEARAELNDAVLAEQRQKEAAREAAAAKKEQVAAEREQARATREAAKEEARLSREAERAHKSMEQSAHRIGKSMLTWGTAMLGVRGVIGLLRKSVSAFLSDNQDVANQLSAIWSAIGNALAPIITRIIGLIQTLFAAISAFVKALTGVDLIANYNAKALEKQADATEGAGSAAEKAERQLASFDEINKLSDTSSSSGGGGGGGGLSDIEFPTLLDDLDNWLTDFAGRLGLTFKDVFFKWDDLDAEDIAMKVITGLGGLFGGIVGFMIGGVPGAIVGTLLGLSLGLVVSTLLFDNDGSLSTAEIVKSLVVVLGTVMGGVAGFALLSSGVGAAIGMAVGIVLSLYLAETLFDWGDNPFLKLKDEMRELHNAFDTAETDYDNNAKSIESAARWAELYATRLEELEPYIDTDARKHEEYRQVVDKLNQLIPDLNLTIDEETGHLSLTTDELRDQIQAWKDLAIQEALTARYKDELAAWADAAIALTDAEQNLADLESEHADILDRLSEKQEELDAITEQFNERIANANGNYGEHISLTNELQAAQDSLNFEYAQLSAELDNNEVMQKKLRGEIETAQTTVDDYAAKVQKAGDAMYAFMDGTTTASDAVTSASDEMNTESSAAVNEMGNEVDSAAKEMNATMTKQSSAMHTHTTNNARKMQATMTTEMRLARKNVGTEATGMSDEVTGAWGDIQSDFSNWSSFWNGLGSKIKNVFSNIGSTLGSSISGAIKTAINNVLAKIQNTVNSAIRIINSAIRVINLLPGVSASYISTVSLPRLARGGIVNNPGMGVPAVIGEAGKEAVLPLERNTEWMDALAEKLAAKTGNNGQVVVPVYLSGKKIAEYIVDLTAKRAFATNNA